jgi:phosphoribosylglycinamide formyltransferase 1
VTRLRRDEKAEDARGEEFRLAVLASGAGTNLQAILDKLHRREGTVVDAVASNKPEAQALERARGAGIATAVFPREEYGDRAARDTALGDWLEERGSDLIVLAGYMELLSPQFVRRFPNRIVNVHPALLPAFPGLDAIGQALKQGVKVAGVSVHFVDEGVDSGPIIAQRAVDVPADGDRETLEKRIHATEHELYPETIRMIAAGRVRIDERNPRLVRVEDERPGGE